MTKVINNLYLFAFSIFLNSTLQAMIYSSKKQTPPTEKQISSVRESSTEPTTPVEISQINTQRSNNFYKRNRNNPCECSDETFENFMMLICCSISGFSIFWPQN